jgi:hypothetical protein
LQKDSGRRCRIAKLANVVDMVMVHPPLDRSLAHQGQKRSFSASRTAKIQVFYHACWTIGLQETSFAHSRRSTPQSEHKDLKRLDAQACCEAMRKHHRRRTSSTSMVPKALIVFKPK